MTTFCFNLLFTTCVFPAQDIFINVFLAAGYFAGAVIAAVFAADLGDFIDPGAPLATIFPLVSDPFQVEKIRNALAATAVSSIIVMSWCPEYCETKSLVE